MTNELKALILDMQKNVPVLNTDQATTTTKKENVFKIWNDPISVDQPTKTRTPFRSISEAHASIRSVASMTPLTSVFNGLS